MFFKFPPQEVKKLFLKIIFLPHKEGIDKTKLSLLNFSKVVRGIHTKFLPVTKIEPCDRDWCFMVRTKLASEFKFPSPIL